eukprot:jgi/Botrbrau1/6952/Bobra.0215s0029.1
MLRIKEGGGDVVWTGPSWMCTCWRRAVEAGTFSRSLFLRRYHHKEPFLDNLAYRAELVKGGFWPLERGWPQSQGIAHLMQVTYICWSNCKRKAGVTSACRSCHSQDAVDSRMGAVNKHMTQLTWSQALDRNDGSYQRYCAAIHRPPSMWRAVPHLPMTNETGRELCSHCACK